jgi:hypothetical protein
MHWAVFATSTFWLLICLMKEPALNGYRYSNGNAMGINIVVVVDQEQVGCCALPDQPAMNDIRHVKLYSTGASSP